MGTIGPPAIDEMPYVLFRDETSCSGASSILYRRSASYLVFTVSAGRRDGELVGVLLDSSCKNDRTET
jgi:hypothetical protein